MLSRQFEVCLPDTSICRLDIAAPLSMTSVVVHPPPFSNCTCLCTCRTCSKLACLWEHLRPFASQRQIRDRQQRQATTVHHLPLTPAGGSIPPDGSAALKTHGSKTKAVANIAISTNQSSRWWCLCCWSLGSQHGEHTTGRGPACRTGARARRRRRWPELKGLRTFRTSGNPGRSQVLETKCMGSS